MSYGLHAPSPETAPYKMQRSIHYFYFGNIAEIDIHHHTEKPIIAMPCFPPSHLKKIQVLLYKAFPVRCPFSLYAHCTEWPKWLLFKCGKPTFSMQGKFLWRGFDFSPRQVPHPVGYWFCHNPFPRLPEILEFNSVLFAMPGNISSGCTTRQERRFHGKIIIQGFDLFVISATMVWK